jgi:hypothetical protein
MKKLYIFILILGVLSGCQSLDTSKLKKINTTGNVTAKELENLPIAYEASTVKEGLDALPFKMKLPEHLPIEMGDFHPPRIEDFDHDGKKIVATFTAFSKDPKDRLLIIVSARNFKAENGGSAEEVEIRKGVTGQYAGNTLNFVKDNIYYGIAYNNKNIDKEHHKQVLIDLANQMLQ